MISKYVEPGDKLELVLLEHGKNKDNESEKRVYLSKVNDILDSQSICRVLLPYGRREADCLFLLCFLLFQRGKSTKEHNTYTFTVQGEGRRLTLSTEIENIVVTHLQQLLLKQQ